MPPLPDPDNPDRAAVNRKILEAIKYLDRKIRELDNDRLTVLEKIVSDHSEIIDG